MGRMISTFQSNRPLELIQMFTFKISFDGESKFNKLFIWLKGSKINYLLKTIDKIELFIYLHKTFYP